MNDGRSRSYVEVSVRKTSGLTIKPDLRESRMKLNLQDVSDVQGRMQKGLHERNSLRVLVTVSIHIHRGLVEVAVLGYSRDRHA